MPINNGSSTLNHNHDISLRKVSVEHKGVLALDNVSLKINKGSKVVIVGKSGSGKTTLLDILSGLISPDRGSVFIGKTKIRPKQLVFMAETNFICATKCFFTLWLCCQKHCAS